MSEKQKENLSEVRGRAKGDFRGEISPIKTGLLISVVKFLSPAVK